MNRLNFKILKKIAAIFVIVFFLIGFANLNQANEKNVVDTATSLNYQSKETVETDGYINNGFREVHYINHYNNKNGVLGHNPVLLENGNVLYYTSSSSHSLWEEVDVETGTSIRGGFIRDENGAELFPEQMMELQDGNIFAINKKNEWYVYSSVDGSIISHGEGQTSGRQWGCIELWDGTIVVYGDSSYWLTITKTSTGTYENSTSYELLGKPSENKITGTSIVYMEEGNNGQLIAADTDENIYESAVVKEDGVVKLESTGNVVHLEDNAGGQWVYDSGSGDNIRNSLKLSNGKIAYSNNKGSVALVDYEDFKQENIIYDVLTPDKASVKDIYDSVEISNTVVFISKSGGYWAYSIETGELIYNGAFEANTAFGGAIAIDENSLFLGGGNHDVVFESCYTFENEVVDVKQTKGNILQWTNSESEHLTTGISTYNDVEDAIRDSTVTKYNAPLEAAYTDVNFYERGLIPNPDTGEYTYKEVTDKSKIWTSDEINFSFSSAGTDEKIIGQTSMYTIDLEFSVAMLNFDVTDVSQSRVQISYKFVIADTNPIVSAKIVSEDNKVITELNPTPTEENESIVEGNVTIEGLAYNTLYENYYLQVEYKQSISSETVITTNSSLDGSVLPPFKTLKDELAIKDNRAVAKTQIGGGWYTVDEESIARITIAFGIYDDGSEKYTPSDTRATIKEVDEYGVLTEKNVKVDVFTDTDNADTIVKEYEATLSVKITPGSTYSNLIISLDNNMEHAISVPVYDENGNVVIRSRAPEEVTNPNHFAFEIIVITLIALGLIIAIVAGIVIYKKHHFHH